MIDHGECIFVVVSKAMIQKIPYNHLFVARQNTPITSIDTDFRKIICLLLVFFCLVRKKFYEFCVLFVNTFQYFCDIGQN